MATSELRTTTVTTPSDREVVMTRVFDAPRRLVWEAYTVPEHLRNWLGPAEQPMSSCEVDLRPGGGYRFVWPQPNGELVISGSYREITPPELLVSTESWGADFPETLNTVAFSELDGLTTITTTIVFPSHEAREAALGTGMTRGYSALLDRLAEYLPTIATKE
jgi:uncharacterized protein YndB with AHSA1/START domain